MTTPDHDPDRDDDPTRDYDGQPHRGGRPDRDARALEVLTEVVRIDSTNPSPQGEAAVAEVLAAHLAAGRVDGRIVTVDGRPSLIARIPGPTDRPPLVLLSHTDVVGVEADAWRHDPFGAEVVDGEVWGRGTLDMKSVAVMHAEALRHLAASDIAPSREVILVAAADEEACGAAGAEALIRDHPHLVGFRDGSPPPEVLGEGAFGLTGVLDRAVLPIVLGERASLRLQATASGDAGHASLPTGEQAIRAIADFVAAVSGPRRARVHPVMRRQFAALAEAADLPAAAVFRSLASPAGPAVVGRLAGLLRKRAGGVLGHLLADEITPTRLHAGHAPNVTPASAQAEFDARLLPDTDPDTVVAWLRGVGRRHGVTVAELARTSGGVTTPSALYTVLAEVSAGLPQRPVVTASLTPATTDLRFFRARGAAAYGWVPLVLTPELLAGVHGEDERVPIDGFTTAVAAMREVVHRAAT